MNLTNKQIDVLKNPLLYDVFSIEEVVSVVFDGTGFYSHSQIEREIGREEVFMEFEGAGTIIIDFKCNLKYGYCSFYSQCAEVFGVRLKKYFRYPLLPTEDEKILFEIEFGIKYPIGAYKEVE